MKHYVLFSLLGISLLALSWCGSTIIEQQKNLCIGIECRVQPTTAEEFMSIFVDQVKQYNEIASTIRPNIAVQGFDAIVVNMERTKARKVDPNGNLTIITVEEADQYAKTVGYDTEFIFPDKTDSRKFIVLTLNEAALQNPESFKKYAHIGTYDLFITYAHELFHKYEQPKRAILETITNREREEFLEEYQARATRGVIIQQLLNAFISPNQATESIKKAIATYRDYQATFSTDAENTHYRDRIEGTAYYVELVSSLRVWYPTLHLHTSDDLYRAYSKISPTVTPEKRIGAGSEGYIVGGLAGLLLDYLHIDRKDELMKDPIKSPLDILAEHFDNEISLADIVFPDEEVVQNYQQLASVGRGPEDIEKAAENMFIILDDMRSKDPVFYETVWEEMKKENQNSELTDRVAELLGEPLDQDKF